ncbi:FAD-dependent oxidoreductase, partial [Candidatus Sumerlaeota bacterium]|nr:FAD-dependent oxidoreductase [Candidatus Sumerlaeota bacterium]
KGFAERPRKYSTSQIMGIVPKMRPFGFTNGFQYFDARMVDSDARLTLDILFDAMDAGLTAANYLEFTSVNRRTGNDLYEIEAEDADLKKKVTIRAKWIVNTTGVWADSVNEKLGVDPPFRHLFSKGIHLVINKIETGGRALTCLSKDGRVFFVIPWGEVTLIGTTDTPFTDPPGRVISDQADIDYLRSECEAKFELTLGDSDILNTKAGLRPLLRPAKMKQEDFLALARSHKVWSDPKARVSCLWGGKYTSCFSMAEEIAATIHLQPSGTLIPEVPLATAALDPNLGMLSGELDEAALRAACLQELVVTTEDLLRRRTNIGLKIARKGQGKSDENRKFLEKLDGVLRKP